MVRPYTIYSIDMHIFKHKLSDPANYKEWSKEFNRVLSPYYAYLAKHIQDENNGVYDIKGNIIINTIDSKDYFNQL